MRRVGVNSFNKYTDLVGQRRCAAIRSAVAHLQPSTLRRHRTEKEYPDNPATGARQERRAQFVFAFRDRPRRKVARNLRVCAFSLRQRPGYPYHDKRCRSRLLCGRESYDKEPCSRSSAETGRQVSRLVGQAADVRAAKAKTGCATGSKDRR